MELKKQAKYDASRTLRLQLQAKQEQKRLQGEAKREERARQIQLTFEHEQDMVRKGVAE